MMRARFIRPFLVLVFLISVQVWLTFWSEVGGQYHLELMFWPWKFGLTLLGAGLITSVVGALVQGDRAVSRRTVVYGVLLVGVMVAAGVVTYWYHVNEPDDDDDSGDEDTPVVSRVWTGDEAVDYRVTALTRRTLGR